MWKNRFIYILFFLFSVTLVLWADGGIEYANGLNLSKTGNFFIVSKVTNYKEPDRAFIAQKTDFTYEIEVINSDSGEKVLSQYKGSSSIPAGKIETRIDATKYMKQLEGKVKRSGHVSCFVRVAVSANYRGPINYESITVENKKAKQELIDTATKNPQLMGKYLKDYQDYMMKNSGKDSDTVNREFLKKYPQYKIFMPQYE